MHGGMAVAIMMHGGMCLTGCGNNDARGMCLTGCGNNDARGMCLTGCGNNDARGVCVSLAAAIMMHGGMCLTG